METSRYPGPGASSFLPVSLRDMGPLLSLWLALAAAPVQADMVPMRDYLQLRNGMHEAEILYRLGAPDYESLSTDSYNNVLSKVWIYIPARPASDAWITEITFDNAGIVQSLRRTRARK